MVVRPWVLPDEVREYSEFPQVQNRKDMRLAFDILRGEQAVIKYTHNRFETFDAIPEPVRLAVILLAEAYALEATEEHKGIKSEAFDDHSYTLMDGVVSTRVDLRPLLEEYLLPEPKQTIAMRLWKL